jgi:hypothetical protein
MAKVKIQGHASGTGILTVTAPNTSTDRTITLPDETGTLLASEGAVTINDTGADVDFRVESDTNTHALFVQGSDGNVGIGVTPDSEWHTDRTSLQIGTAGLTQHNSYPHGLDLIANGILKTSGEKQLNTGHPSNKLQLWNGTFLFKHEAAGNAAISWDTQLEITADGRGLSQFTAKAWINFRGESTVAINDSHNISSVTDNGTGDYTINFSNNMANVNFSVAAMSEAYSQYGDYSDTTTAFAVGSLRFGHREGGSLTDAQKWCGQFFGD